MWKDKGLFQCIRTYFIIIASIKYYYLCAIRSIELHPDINSELGSSQPVVVCFRADKNSLSGVGQSARRSSPACNLCFLPQPSSKPQHAQPHTTTHALHRGIYRLWWQRATQGEETVSHVVHRRTTNNWAGGNLTQEGAWMKGMHVSRALAFTVTRC